MEMTMRPMFPAERNYCYAQSQQISMQTGLIGYLRADMDSNGKGFFSTWNGFRDSLKSEDFKLEFDDVINELRKDGNILHDRSTMARCCHATPDSDFKNDRNEFGFRVDTDHYTYMMRLNPSKGEYNLYCHCYVRQWLERHMKLAERGIRFITPDYKELFRIADGDSIRYYTASGEIRQPTCRYIDDYHFETGSPGFGNLYHICEFAEKYESHGCTGIIPLRSSLPEKCFSHLESTGEVIVITKGEKGYTPTGNYALGTTPEEAVTALNKANKVTPAQRVAMVAGSMFGWAVPAADPKNYDENGIAIAPKPKDRGDAR